QEERVRDLVEWTRCIRAESDSAGLVPAWRLTKVARADIGVHEPAGGGEESGAEDSRDLSLRLVRIAIRAGPVEDVLECQPYFRIAADAQICPCPVVDEPIRRDVREEAAPSARGMSLGGLV